MDVSFSHLIDVHQLFNPWFDLVQMSVVAMAFR